MFHPPSSILGCGHAALRPMPLKRLFNRCLLQPVDLPASQENLKVIGTFNPAAVATEQGVTLLVRVAEQPAERRPGQTGLPRWDPDSRRVVIDWEHDHELAPVDSRVVHRKRHARVQLTFVSHLQVIHSRDGRSLDARPGTTFGPANEYEEFGVEDPRLTRIGDTFYFTYVAVSRHGVATALASTKDFQSFARHGIIFPPENKDVVLFPEKIGGQFWALHRPSGCTPLTRPEMWQASSPDLIHWGRHGYFLKGDEPWDIGRIGAGTPPLRTPKGWLEIFHGNSRREEDQGIGAYSAGALLLDLENPQRILGAAGQLLVPETDYERRGFVPNVVFPTGLVDQGDTVLLYYGAADTCTAVVEFSLPAILKAIE